MADESGAIASAAITQLGNYAISAAANKRQFKFQQQAMAKQQEYNKELWDYQNAYNTPQQQMERLKAAGLNPRLIYGSGAASAGNAGPIAPTEVPSRQATKQEFSDPNMTRLIARQMDAQFAATQQNMEVMRTRASLNEISQASLALKNMRETARSKYYDRMALSEQKLMKFQEYKAEEVFHNEQKKGTLLDQLAELRQGTIQGQSLDNAFKANRNELAKYGVYSTDHPLLRIMMQAAHRQGISLDELLSKGKNALGYLVDLVK